MTNDNHKPSATGRGSGCCLQRFVRLLPDDKLGWGELICWVLAVVTLGLIAVLYWVIWNGVTPAK